jgi:hypothetical protein
MIVKSSRYPICFTLHAFTATFLESYFSLPRNLNSKKNIVEYRDRKRDEHPEYNPEKFTLQACKMLTFCTYIHQQLSMRCIYAKFEHRIAYAVLSI